MPSGGAANIIYIVFGLTRSLFEPTIYRTGGEHADHYTTIYRTGGEHADHYTTIYRTGGEHADHYTIDVVDFEWTKTLICII